VCWRDNKVDQSTDMIRTSSPTKLGTDTDSPIRNSDRYSIDGWRLSDSESGSKGYISDAGEKYQGYGSTDKYAIHEKFSSISSSSYNTRTCRYSSRSSESDALTYESSFASDGASIEVSSSGRLSSVSSSSADYSLETHTNQSTLGSLSDLETHTNQSTLGSLSNDTTPQAANPEHYRYASLQYSASSAESYADQITFDEQLTKTKETEDSIKGQDTHIDWEPRNCAETIAELNWMFQDECDHMTHTASSNNESTSEGKDTHATRTIQVVSNYSSFPSSVSRNTSTKELLFDGEGSDSSFSTVSTRSEDLHKNPTLELENFPEMQKEKATGPGDVPPSITEPPPTLPYNGDDSLVTVELPSEPPQVPTQDNAIAQFQQQARRSQEFKAPKPKRRSQEFKSPKPKDNSFATEITESIFHLVDSTFMFSLCERKVTAPVPHEQPCDLSKESQLAKNRTITHLYSEIHSRNTEEAVRRLREHPEEARTWVACCDTISNEGGILKPVTVQFLPLHAACLCHSPAEFVKELIIIYPGAIRSRAGNSKYPIHIACEAGAEPEVVSLLIDLWPGSIYALDGENNIPLTNLIRSKPLSPRKSDIMKLLLAAFATFSEQKTKTE
jgi:hypothetical protein